MNTQRNLIEFYTRPKPVARTIWLHAMGHNGAGKSTLMKLALGVLAPSAGRVGVLGEDPRGRHARTLLLLMTYPLSRTGLLAGKFLGRGAILASSTALGSALRR